MHDSIQHKQQRFLALFEPHEPRLRRFVLVMTRNEELAKDIIGETILIAFERLDFVRDEKAFLSFLFTIATRVHRRWRRKHTGATATSDEELARALDPGTPPDVAADVAAMFAALELLPEKQREAVILFEILGFSMNEIREIQGGTGVAVRVRIARARKKLAEILGVEDAPVQTDDDEQTSSDTLMNTSTQHFHSMRVVP